jgi:hypothetical protein
MESTQLAFKSTRRLGRDKSNVVTLTPDEVETIATILQHPWFTRIWVLQEVVLSKAAYLVCGDLVISWKE